MGNHEREEELVAPDEPSPADPAGGSHISCPAEAAATVPSAPDKAAAPEIGLCHDGLVAGSALFETLSAHIA